MALIRTIAQRRAWLRPEWNNNPEARRFRTQEATRAAFTPEAIAKRVAAIRASHQRMQRLLSQDKEAYFLACWMVLDHAATVALAKVHPRYQTAYQSYWKMLRNLQKGALHPLETYQDEVSRWKAHQHLSRVRARVEQELTQEGYADLAYLLTTGGRQSLGLFPRKEA